MVKKVMVIDDTADMRLQLTTYLQFAGMDTCDTGDIDDVVPMAIREQPDAIICDYTMPEADGVEVLYMIREHPELQDVPVVLYSCAFDSRNRDFMKLKREGFAGILEKNLETIATDLMELLGW